MAVIDVHNLSHAYNKKPVLKNVCFSVEKGRILGIIGKNGAGKSTTINVLNGFLFPNSGSVKVFGENSNELTADTRRRIGVLFEGHLLHNYMTLKEVANYTKSFFPQWDDETYNKLTLRLKLLDKQKISTLSCGQRSQVALALLLAQRAELLILDDFSMGLDPGYRRLFVETLKSYVQYHNTTVLITSHIIQDLEYLVDDILLLNKGEALFNGTLTSFMQSIARYKVLLVEPQVVNPEVLWFANDVFQVENELFILSRLALNELLGAFAALNIQVTQIKSIPMSLEDAFIGLTGKF